MYCRGLDLQVLGQFEDHDGFDGAMLGTPGSPYHFEFTYCRTHPVEPRPTKEDLLVYYIGNSDEWNRCADQMQAAGFRLVESLNPYWNIHGQAFEDPDGYRIVLAASAWASSLTY